MKNFQKLIKESYLGNPLNEATDFNDPALVKARAAQMKRDKIEADEKAKKAYLDKKYGKNFMDKLEAEIVLKQQLDDLKSEYDDIINFQQENDPEVRPEGGEKADEYGSRLNDINSRMELIQKDIDDLRMYESLNEDKKPKQVNIAVVDGFGVYSVKVEFEDGSTEKFRSEEEAEEKYNLDGVLRQEFEMDVSESVNEGKYLSNKDSYIRISEPSFRKDKNNPNFLSGYIKYDTGPGVGIALGKETMAGQIRRLSSQEAVRQMEIIAKKLNDSFDLEDIEVTDLENGVVELFAVSDDFIDMDPRSELSMAMLGENQKYDDEDIVIYDGEEHIIMRRDGNDVYIRPLEDSAILGKKDEIKVPARALAYKSDLDKMYDKYKPKDEINEENEKLDHIARAEYGKSFAMLSDEEKEEMLKAIAKYSKPAFKTDYQRRRQGDYSDDRDDGMTDYQRGRMDENMGEWPKELTSRYSDEYRFELEKVSPTYQDKPGRAKYRVIDIESGELKGTPVFGTPESLMAYADDLIKPQGGTQSSNFGESLQESLRKKLQERLK